MSTEELCRAYVAARERLIERRERVTDAKFYIGYGLAISASVHVFQGLPIESQEAEIMVLRKAAQIATSRLKGRAS